MRFGFFQLAIFSFAVLFLGIFLRNSFIGVNLLSKDNPSKSVSSTFATLNAKTNSEIYLKEARVFIFSPTESGQSLKVHDSVLVGPSSEATLLLSQEFGGGKIHLAANTIVTLSIAGRKNKIPRIELKQGKLSILESPKLLPRQQRPVSEVIISSGGEAIIFDENILNAELIAIPSLGALEIKMPQTPISDEILQHNKPIPVSLEAIENAALTENTLKEVVTQLQEKSTQMQSKETSNNKNADEQSKFSHKIDEKLTKERTGLARIRKVEDKNSSFKAQSSLNIEKVSSDKNLQQRAPAESIQPQDSEDSFQRKGVFSIATDFNSTKITGVDRTTRAKATLISKSNMGVVAEYSHLWSQKLQTHFSFGASQLSIKEPSSGSTLIKSKQTLYSFGAAAKYQFSPKLSLLTDLGLKQRVFLKALSTTAVVLDPLYVPSIGFLASYDIFQMNPFAMGVSLGAGLDLPSSEGAYKTKLNPNYQSAFFVKHDINPRIKTEVGLNAKYLIQNTSITEQTQTDLGIYLRMSFSFGEPKK